MSYKSRIYFHLNNSHLSKKNSKNTNNHKNKSLSPKSKISFQTPNPHKFWDKKVICPRNQVLLPSKETCRLKRSSNISNLAKIKWKINRNYNNSIRETNWQKAKVLRKNSRLTISKMVVLEGLRKKWGHWCKETFRANWAWGQHSRRR